MFRSKKKKRETDEARRAATTASVALSEAKGQRPAVQSLADRLRERREINHFGDDFTISLTPRGQAR